MRTGRLTLGAVVALLVALGVAHVADAQVSATIRCNLPGVGLRTSQTGPFPSCAVCESRWAARSPEVRLHCVLVSPCGPCPKAAPAPSSNRPAPYSSPARKQGRYRTPELVQNPAHLAGVEALKSLASDGAWEHTLTEAPRGDRAVAMTGKQTPSPTASPDPHRAVASNECGRKLLGRIEQDTQSWAADFEEEKKSFVFKEIESAATDVVAPLKTQALEAAGVAELNTIYEQGKETISAKTKWLRSLAGVVEACQANTTDACEAQVAAELKDREAWVEWVNKGFAQLLERLKKVAELLERYHERLFALQRAHALAAAECLGKQ